MSRSAVPRIALYLSHAPRPTRLGAIDSPCRKLTSRAQPATLHGPSAVRTLSTTNSLLKKAGKANKTKARSDSSPPTTITPSTPTDEAYDVSGIEAAVLTAIEHLTHDLSQLRSGGRVNPEIVESLKVQLGTQREGKQTVKLKDIAQVVPKGRLLNVMCGEQEHVKPVTSAIAASPHSLSPQQPHQDTPLTIPVPVPPPTGESRQKALEAAQKISEQADRAIHDARAAHNKMLRRFEKERAVLPDDMKKAKKSMEEVIKKGHTEVKRIVEGAKKVLESQ
ncbi:ribosome recycling factor [Polyplosphaeria fusca]|uniref:Ribosome recycling factor n=1 Tax=Polyplosphaeria fusca TaxID=682080 RepID=A0A9P4RA89_9PLEO|nr:ribosome recycling factor [Polyplosphaeria fusca]